MSKDDSAHSPGGRDCKTESVLHFPVKVVQEQRAQEATPPRHETTPLGHPFAHQRGGMLEPGNSESTLHLMA